MTPALVKTLRQVSEAALNEAVLEILSNPEFREAVPKHQPTICNAPHIPMCKLFQICLMEIITEVEAVDTVQPISLASSVYEPKHTVYHHEYVIVNRRFLVDGTALQFSDITPERVVPGAVERVLIIDLKNEDLSDVLTNYGIPEKYHQFWERSLQDRHRELD